MCTLNFKTIAVMICMVIFIKCSPSSDPNPTNGSPIISSITANPDSIEINGTSELICNASDPDGDSLNYIWEASLGSTTGSGPTVIWTAPNSVGTYSVSCTVEDGSGDQDIDSISILVQQSIPTQGLIAYWPFNGNANDESGNGHNGTVNGATLTNDRFGNENNAYHFDGNDYITIADDPIFTFGTNPFSLSFWINIDQIGSYYMMGHDEGGGNTRKWIFWFTGSSLGLHERLNGGYWVINSPWEPEINKWYYINLVRYQNTFSIYVDASLIGSNEDSRSIPDPRTTLLIGNAEETGRMFRGMIDDVRFYSSSLTTLEINNLYHENGWGN